MLSVEAVAVHYGLKPDTVRAKIRAGELGAVRINRGYRLAWPEIWACERGPMPAGPRRERYRTPLMSKADLAVALSVSTRTIERWIAAGLPTRAVFGAVRLNRDDAADWLRHAVGVALPEAWWRS